MPGYQGNAGTEGRSEDAATAHRGQYTEGLHRPGWPTRCDLPALWAGRQAGQVALRLASEREDKETVPLL